MKLIYIVVFIKIVSALLLFAVNIYSIYVDYTLSKSGNSVVMKTQILSVVLIFDHFLISFVCLIGLVEGMLSISDHIFEDLNAISQITRGEIKDNKLLFIYSFTVILALSLAFSNRVSII